MAVMLVDSNDTALVLVIARFRRDAPAVGA
jgi:hypothetical protein